MRPFHVVDVVQGSEEWRALRRGLVTGSRAVKMLATVAKGEAAGRRDLRTQLVLERLTGESQDSTFMSPEMRWGVEKEPEARALYQAITGQLVRRVGFVKHLSEPVGYSPDGVIGDFDGLIECKAPKSATHMTYLRTGVIPYDYLCQIRHGLYLTGAPFCDFVSYDPRFPPTLRLFVSRVERNVVGSYQEALVRFLTEVEAEHATVTALMKKQEAA